MLGPNGARFMKTKGTILLLMAASLAYGATDPFAEEDWLREGLAQQIPKFKKMTLMPHPEQRDVVVVNCETDPAWLGSLRVFHHVAGQIDWIAREPAAYVTNRGHYVLSCEWRYLEKLQFYVLEVFESTHMGNGSVWLFALEGHELRVLLHTTARGRFLRPPPDLSIPPLGETRLVEDHLVANYRVPDGGLAENVILTGTIEALDDEGKRQSTKPYAETWMWDAAKRVFERSEP
jgi:hypothetical protein